MRVPVEGLQPGDMVDLESCPYLNGLPSAPFEYALVEGTERETADCVRVDYATGEGACGYQPGTVLEVVRRGQSL